MATDATTAGQRQRVKVIVAKDVMSASIMLTRPSNGEDAFTEDEILEALALQDVVYGLDRDAIARVITGEQYNTPVQVARGLMPGKGRNAVFTYNFNTTEQHQPKVDKHGNVDYKEISFIQNCEAGTVLVTKTPPTQGDPGRTITGREITGPIGRDASFNIGANTKVTEDCLHVVAAKGGVIQMHNGKVSIVDVVTIGGDVDFSVGNLDCRGSVRVAGNIKSGFELTVDGDLEVGGNIEDCTIRVQGNIYVKGGFFGSGIGIMKAGGDIVLKYAEGQRISSGHDIIVTGEIINCTVSARNKVQVKGKRGKIVGGEVRAGREIRAAVLGSPAGTFTSLLVGYNDELFAQYNQIGLEISRTVQDGERVKDALSGLSRLDLMGKLPAAKREIMGKLQFFLDGLPEALGILEAQKAEIVAKIKELSGSRIVADEIVHPGVRAAFGLVYRDFILDVGRCMLTVDGHQVIQSDGRQP